MERLIGVMSGHYIVNCKTVKRFIKTRHGFELAMNSIDYKALTVNTIKELQADIEGEIAYKLGLMLKFSDGTYESSGRPFPKEVPQHFELFFELLKKICNFYIVK